MIVATICILLGWRKSIKNERQEPNQKQGFKSWQQHLIRSIILALTMNDFLFDDKNYEMVIITDLS